MRKLKLTSLAILLMAGAAHAADPEVIVASDNNFEQRWSWTGFFAGLEAGYSWSSDETLPPLAPLSCFVPSCTAAGTGGIYGAFLGYNYQYGDFVGGVEGSYTRIDNVFDDGSEVAIDDVWSVKARLGYAIDRYLVYGLVGASYVTTSVPAAVPYQQFGASDWGYVYGAGLDIAITENIFGGIQYTHHQFDEFNGQAIDAQMDNVTVRVGYKF